LFRSTTTNAHPHHHRLSWGVGGQNLVMQKRTKQILSQQKNTQGTKQTPKTHHKPQNQHTTNHTTNPPPKHHHKNNKCTHGGSINASEHTPETHKQANAQT
jgi:hypothetical protein